MAVLRELILMIFYILFAVGNYESAPVNSEINTGASSLSAIDFMKKYGYMERGTADSEALYKKNALTEAVSTLQKFGNIPVTGKLDNATLELMASPRCGVPDILREKEDVHREKRYVIGSTDWKKGDLTNFIANWIPSLTEETVEDKIERALNTWSGYSRLNFKRIHNPNADIIIDFGRGPHGDESVHENKKK